MKSTDRSRIKVDLSIIIVLVFKRSKVAFVFVLAVILELGCSVVRACRIELAVMGSRAWRLQDR